MLRGLWGGKYEIIFKADDLSGITDNVLQLDELIKRQRIRVSWGIIGSSLRNYDKDFIEFLKKNKRFSRYHFFNHGWLHLGGEEDEFKNKNMTYQLEALQNTQRIVAEKIGLVLNTFGAPCNHIDDNTLDAMERIPELRYWYYANPKTTKINILRSFELEKGVGKPNYDFFVENWTKCTNKARILTFQIHPNMWSQDAFAEFEKIVLFLKKKGCRFITPNQVSQKNTKSKFRELIARFIQRKNAKKERQQMVKTFQEQNSRTLSKLRKELKTGRKIKIGFYVVFDSVFPAEKIYKECINDDLFEPFIFVIPDVSRGEANMWHQMDKTYATLSKKYKNVRKSYDEKTKQFIDISDSVDMAFFANPYDGMTHEFYSIEYNVKHGVLPLYVSYGAMPSKNAIRSIITMPSLSQAWLVFADTAENYNDFKKYTAAKGKNVILTGYCKMDELSQVPVEKRKRTKIIIAPHHTVSHRGLPLSTFMTYHKFFLRLPELYPDIDFVFRPHPLLFVTLSRPELWGAERVHEYIAKMTAHKNVEYQDGGDYFDTFINSDALIHDCASFMLEYLYTDHPVCFLIKTGNKNSKIFAKLGLNCIKHHYKAFNEKQILDFINDVVIAKNDPMAVARHAYAQTLKLNYPYVSRAIVEHIKGLIQ